MLGAYDVVDALEWRAPLYEGNEGKLRCIHIVQPLFPDLLPYFPHALIEGGCIGRSTYREPLLPPSSALKPYWELRRPLSNRILSPSR